MLGFFKFLHKISGLLSGCFDASDAFVYAVDVKFSSFQNTPGPYLKYLASDPFPSFDMFCLSF